MSKSLGSAILSIMGSRVTISVIGVLFTPILVRFLGPTSYGRYAVLLSVFAFANFIMTSGTNDAIRKFISERDDRDWQNAVFGKIGRIAFLLALAVALSFILSAKLGIVERVFGDAYVSLFYFLALYAVGRQAQGLSLRTLQGLQLETYSEPIKIAQRISFVVLALAGAYYGHGVAGVLTANFLASFAVLIVVFLILRRRLDLRDAVFEAPDVEVPTRSIYKYTGSTVLYFGLLMSLYNVDILILQQFETEAVVGYYKSALVIAENLWMVPVALQMALLQRVSSHWEDGNLDVIQDLASKLTRFSAAFTLLIVLGVAALADIFVPLYLGADFARAATPLVLLLPGVLGFATARPTLAINQARRSLRPLILATGGCAAVNVLFNLLLIPQYGMVGAAVSTSIGYGSLVVFQSWAAHSLGYSPVADLRLGKIALTGLLAAVPIFGFAWLLPSMAALLIVPAVGFAVYATVAISIGLFTTSELEPVLSSLPTKLEVPLRRILSRIPRVWPSRGDSVHDI